MKKKDEKGQGNNNPELDTELLRMYMMGATNPKFSNKNIIASDVIDLHLENLQVGKGKIAPSDALFFQLEKFEAALDAAIAAGKMEFRVVHGLGKGKLKGEIEKLLKKNPNVRSWSNDYHSQFGYGSTLILLK